MKANNKCYTLHCPRPKELQETPFVESHKFCPYCGHVLGIHNRFEKTAEPSKASSGSNELMLDVKAEPLTAEKELFIHWGDMEIYNRLAYNSSEEKDWDIPKDAVLYFKKEDVASALALVFEIIERRKTSTYSLVHEYYNQGLMDVKRAIKECFPALAEEPLPKLHQKESTKVD